MPPSLLKLPKAYKNYMSSKNTLILLTQKFPFEFGEEFLENELNFLSLSFGRIYLIPTGVRDFSRSRNVPKNVVVINVKNPQGQEEIFSGLTKKLPQFIPLFIRELIASGINGGAVKFLLYHIPYALQIKKTIKSLIKPGNNYCFYSYWMDTNAYALALLHKENPNFRFVVRSHGGDLYNERNPQGQILFRRFVYDHASLIAPVSKHGTAYIVDNWPQYKPKVKTSYLGVNNQGLGPINNGNLIRIISCSSLIPLKRVDKILEVVSLLPFEVEWIHFGGLGKELERLKISASGKLKAPSKLLAKGQINHTELMAFYQSIPCDLFINLSESEGIPVSIMEAISFGIPVLSNDVGGVGEIVTDQTGILVKVDDKPDIITQKILHFVATGDYRSPEFRKQILDFWQLNFNAARNYTSFGEEVQKYTSESIVKG